VSPDPTYAGFWRRLLAFLIDYLVIGVVQLGLYSVSLLRLGGDPKTVSASIAASSAATWAYFAVMESSPLQATLGKLAIGIRVADARGGPLTFRRASLRYWAKWLSSLTLMIGWLMAAFTPRRQALHEGGREDPERMLETAEDHFGLPTPSLAYWKQSQAQRPWRDRDSA